LPRAATEASGETEQGRALFQELLWVHSMIRRDLDTVERLATEVTDGMPADDVRAELEELKTAGPLWMLRMGCLRYCRFVHLHHRLEDTALFPLLRETDPDVGPVVDRLEADHRRVHDLLNDVEEAAGALGEDADLEARKRVADALALLSEHLLEHLEFEEREAGPTLRRLERF
jgi:Hemerythrin HHE cation binding domain